MLPFRPYPVLYSASEGGDIAEDQMQGLSVLFGFLSWAWCQSFNSVRNQLSAAFMNRPYLNNLLRVLLGCARATG